MIPIWIFEYYASQCTTISPYKNLNRIDQLKNFDADFIIIGNSRAEQSYNDSIFSDKLDMKCVNIGWSGYPFDYQYNIMYKTYMKNNKPPKYMLVEIGPWAFFDYVNPNYIVEFLPYLNRKEFEFYIDLCPEVLQIDRYCPLHKYAGMGTKIDEQLKKIRNGDDIRKHKNTFTHNYIKEEKPLENNPNIIKLFRSFLTECDTQGIKVILICSPIHTDEGKVFFDMNRFWNLIHNLVPSKIPILNYVDLYHNDTIFFADPMHLNPYGKDCYSTKVANDIKSLHILAN